MDERELTPEQEAEFEALGAEYVAQLDRVGVDMREASPQLLPVAPPVEQWISEDEFELTLTLDVGGFVETLRALPDGAGTSAFVAAYNARRRASGPQAS